MLFSMLKIWAHPKSLGLILDLIICWMPISGEMPQAAAGNEDETDATFFHYHGSKATACDAHKLVMNCLRMKKF